MGQNGTGGSVTASKTMLYMCLYMRAGCLYHSSESGVLPADDPGEEESLVKTEMNKIKADMGSEVTEEDVMKALNKGEEASSVFIF